MTGNENEHDETSRMTTAHSDWPVFSIRHTYNPQDIGTDVRFEANEVVMYDTTTDEDGRWISAKYGSYVEVSDVR